MVLILVAPVACANVVVSISDGESSGEESSSNSSTSEINPTTGVSNSSGATPMDTTGGDPTTSMSECGNGVVEGEEECDEGGGGCFSCRKDRRIFVTEQHLAPGFGGLHGADYICQLSAINAGLVVDETNRFWPWLGGLRYNLVDPPIEIPFFEGRITLVTGELVADSWEGLLLSEGETLHHPVNVNEWGQSYDGVVWTNVDPVTGMMLHSELNLYCGNWSNVTDGHLGQVGLSYAVDTEWLVHGTRVCSLASLAPLYCVEGRPY